MTLVSLYELRRRVRQACDMEDDATFVTDEELDGYINRGLWALDEVLHLTWEDYYLVSYSLATGGLGPISSLALPADFYKLVSLDALADGRWGQMAPFSVRERNSLLNSASSNTNARAVRYRLSSGTISFAPPLPPNTPVSISYYPQQAPLSVADDRLEREYLNGWEEWAVLYAAIRVMTKEERDTTSLEKLWAMEDSRIRTAAPVRDEQQLTPGAPGDECDPYLGQADRGAPRW